MPETEQTTIHSTCVECAQPVAWVDCPTGGWWAHDSHPADDHDAQVKCRWCAAPAYGCTETHTDGSGPTMHCSVASLHNFPVTTTADQKD